MIPRLAALSIAEMTPGIPSNLDTSEERACFCIVRRRVTTLRLRSDRFNVWRARLTADFVLAIAYLKIVDVDARGRNWHCQERATCAAAQLDAKINNEWAQSRPAPRREEFCFARPSRRCSALAPLYLSGEPHAFVAPQRALPPFASARP